MAQLSHATERERERERGGGGGGEGQTFQVSMNNAMFVEIHNAIDDLSGVVRDDTLCKPSKVVQNLVQAATSHPLYEDIDVSLMLGGPQTAHYVGVGETTQHHYLLVKPLQFCLLLCLCVPHITHLAWGDRGRQTGYTGCGGRQTCLTAIIVPSRVSLARKQEQNAPVPMSLPLTQSFPSR